MRILFLHIFAALFLFPGSVFACSCAADSFGPEASKKNIEKAAYIIEGHVSFVAPADEEKDERYQKFTAFGITVDRTLKGEALPMLTAYANTASTCGLTIENLKRLEFFILYQRDEDLILAGACQDYISPADRKALRISANLKR